jgi:hypothetical protein
VSTTPEPVEPTTAAQTSADAEHAPPVQDAQDVAQPTPAEDVAAAPSSDEQATAGTPAVDSEPTSEDLEAASPAAAPEQAGAETAADPQSDQAQQAETLPAPEQPEAPAAEQAAPEATTAPEQAGAPAAEQAAPEATTAPEQADAPAAEQAAPEATAAPEVEAPAAAPIEAPPLEALAPVDAAPPADPATASTAGEADEASAPAAPDEVGPSAPVVDAAEAPAATDVPDDSPDAADTAADADQTDAADQADPAAVADQTDAADEADPAADADQAQTAADEDGAASETGEGPTGGKRRRKKGKGGQGETQAAEAAPKQEQQKKRKGPEPSEVTARIGTTNDRALAYLANPDPALSRLSRKVTEALLPDLHPVTGAALVGPAGFTRHLVASAAAGRYRDLFVLWETFRRFPAEAKPELAERGAALERARRKLATAVRIGLTGRSAFLAQDIARAEGLIWQWLREELAKHLAAVGSRPAIASALLEREPNLEVPLPAHPDDRWLDEAAAARQGGPLAEPVEALLAANVHRLPATVDTLRLATLHYPERVAALVDRVDLDAPDIGAFLAWARDHNASDRLHGRIRERVAGAAARDRAEGLARWYSWQQRGVHLELPEALRVDTLEGFDLAKPETAELAKRLVSRGMELDLQGQLDAMAAENRQRAEKAYEAMVCADLDVHLPAALEGNPMVNEGTRCPKCRAWTWVRPGHEARCPRPEPAESEPVLDPFELAAAEAGPAEPTS